MKLAHFLDEGRNRITQQSEGRIVLCTLLFLLNFYLRIELKQFEFTKLTFIV